MTNSTVHLMAFNPRKTEFIGAAPCWCGHRKHNPKLWWNTVCIFSFMAVVDAIKRNEWKGVRESNWFPKRDPWITSRWRKGLSLTEATQEWILTQTPGEERYPACKKVSLCSYPLNSRHTGCSLSPSDSGLRNEGSLSLQHTGLLSYYKTTLYFTGVKETLTEHMCRSEEFSPSSFAMIQNWTQVVNSEQRMPFNLLSRLTDPNIFLNPQLKFQKDQLYSFTRHKVPVQRASHRYYAWGMEVRETVTSWKHKKSSSNKDI